MVDMRIVVELINETLNVRKIHVVDICCLTCITENFIFVLLLAAVLIMVGDLFQRLSRNIIL